MAGLFLHGDSLLGGCLVVLPSFFFQAEDGIRDIGVTGVQTCALPISPRRAVPARGGVARGGGGGGAGGDRRGAGARSEERRVGKECRSRWSRYDERKESWSIWKVRVIVTEETVESVADNRGGEALQAV